MKNVKLGISLIMLIITIVIIIILASAVILTISNSGIFDNANYATMLSNMSAVKESINLYQITNDEIPITKNMTIEELNANKKLKQEIGYYRVYAITKEKPDITQDFSGEFIETPNGIGNLEYIDNEKLGISGNDKYIYDSINDIVYVTKEMKLKGLAVYSDIRAREIMDMGYIVDVGQGDTVIPPSPGKVDYSLISGDSEWIYKHYTNGDVYAIGKKGPQINTSVSEMENINQYKWAELKINEIIGDYIKIDTSSNDIYVIDKNNELWAWGNNANNKYGLTTEQQSALTNRMPIKLNVDGKKVKEIYDYSNASLFVITTDNELYVCGKNQNYNLGLGHNNNVNTFTKLNIPNIENIEYINNNSFNTFIKYKNNTYFYAGKNSFGELGIGTTQSNYYYTFKQIWHEGIYDIDQDIESIEIGCTTSVIKKDGTVLRAGYTGYDGGAGSLSLEDGDQKIFRKFKDNLGTNVLKVWTMDTAKYILRINELNEQEVWVAPGLGGYVNSGIELLPSDSLNKYYKIDLPEELKTSGIKEVCTTYGTTYYIANNGTIFANGKDLGMGDDLKSSTKVVKLNISNASVVGRIKPNNIVILKGQDNKLYTTGKSNFMYQNDIIQMTWKKVASNVKKIIPGAYIDNNNDLWVAGNDKSILGLGSSSEESVPVYIKNTDTNIQGKVKDVWTIQSNLFVLTTDGKLYSTGKYIVSSAISGWNDTNNRTSFVKILDNVKDFYVWTGNAVAITNNNEWYGWGAVVTATYRSSVNAITPTKFDITDIDITTIKNIYLRYRSIFIINNSNELYVSGNHDDSNLGTGYITKTITKINPSLFNNEEIVKISASNIDFRFALTNKGNLYGWGYSKYLGINDSSNKEITYPLKCDITDVKDVISGDKFTIVIKNNGEVWGTGDNSNGILGRWISKEGTYAPNRYKTAYEWVRCVDLEK